MNMWKRSSCCNKMLAFERGALLARSRCIRGSMMQGIPIREKPKAQYHYRHHRRSSAVGTYDIEGLKRAGILNRTQSPRGLVSIRWNG